MAMFVLYYNFIGNVIHDLTDIVRIDFHAFVNIYWLINHVKHFHDNQIMVDFCLHISYQYVHQHIYLKLNHKFCINRDTFSAADIIECMSMSADTYAHYARINRYLQISSRSSQTCNDLFKLIFHHYHLIHYLAYKCYSMFPYQVYFYVIVVVTNLPIFRLMVFRLVPHQLTIDHVIQTK